MTAKRPRLIVFTTHPIQYQAPWFRVIEESGAFDLLVAFSYIPTESEQAVGFGGAFKWDIPLRDGYRSLVLRHGRLRWLPRFLRRPVFGIGRLLDEFRPDLVVILGWQELSLVQAMWICVRRGLPILLRGESVPRPGRGALKRYALARLVRSATAVLAIGARNRQFYVELGVDEAQIVNAPYCVDNERFAVAAEKLRAERSSIRRRLGVPEAAFCVLFVGKFEAKKRPLDLIEAVALARQQGADVHPLLVGDGPLLADCEAHARRLCVPYSSIGFRNQSELPEAYVAADALVLPSDRRETWGLVVNEAMACGLPAIVSDQVGCAPDLVRDGETGALFRCGDSHRLADLICQWAHNRERVALMGGNARALVRREYSLARALKGLTLAVERALSQQVCR